MRFPQMVVTSKTVFLLMLVVMLVSNMTFSQAQDETLTATPSGTPTEASTATALPTETATATLEMPTETAVSTATLKPALPEETESVNPSLTPEGATATPLPLSTATALPTEPPLSAYFVDNFDTGDLTAWTLGAGWALVASETGQALQVVNSDQPAHLPSINLFNSVMQLRFRSITGTLRLSVRQSNVGSYTLALAPDGQMQLYRLGVLWQTAQVASSQPEQWRTLRLSVIEGVVRAAIDGAEVFAVYDAAMLPPGSMSLSASFPALPEGADLNQNTLLVDDVAVGIPTAEMPIATAVVTTTETVLSPTVTETASPSATPEALSPEPLLTAIFTDNFDHGEAILWTLGEGWSFALRDSGLALQGTVDGSLVTFNNPNIYNAAVEAHFQINAGTAQFSTRVSEAGRYTAALSLDGQVTLYRDAVLLGTAAVEPLSAGDWHTLRISTFEDVLRVAVGGIEVLALRDAAPLPVGTVAFSASDSGTTFLQVDDFVLWIAGEPVTATPTATANPFPPEPELTLLNSENFDDYEQYTSSWWLMDGFSLQQSSEGQYVQIEDDRNYIEFMAGIPYNAAVQGRFKLNAGAAELSVRRSFIGVYTATLAANGEVALYRRQTLLQSVVLSDFNAAQWHTLRLSAVDDVVRVVVDEQEIIVVNDSDPLPSGMITLAARDLNGTVLLADDLMVWGENEVNPPSLSLARSASIMSLQSGTTITVDTITQEQSSIVNGNCTLGEAIHAANTDTAVDGCAAGSGDDTIVLSPSSIYELIGPDYIASYGVTGLPVITTNITIMGNGSTIERNSTEEFRVLGVHQTGSLTLNNITISGGTLAPLNRGGGILNFDGTLIIEAGSIIKNHYANGSGGGGIRNWGTLIIRDSTITSNTAYEGAGILSTTAGILSITNSAIIDNTAYNNLGGGIHLIQSLVQENATTVIENSRITGNHSASRGGGIYISPYNGNLSTYDINNNCFHSNSIDGIIAASGGSGLSAYNSAGTINAKDNWWGDSSGPLVGNVPIAPRDSIYWYVNPIDYEPYLDIEPSSCDAPIVKIPGDSTNILLFTLPSPPTADLQVALNQFANGSNPDNLTFSTDLYGECGTSEEEHIACVRYAYVTFYALFIHYTGTPPTIWDLLSSIYHGELGNWGQISDAAEALSRNFFDNSELTQGGCPYYSSINEYQCSYTSMVKWLSSLFWIQKVVTDSTQTRVNVPALIGFETMRKFAEYIENNYEFPVSTAILHFDAKTIIGIFAHDGYIWGGVNGFNGIEANLVSNNWRSGQSDSRPSNWGNLTLPPGTTSYTTNLEQFSPVIIHNFYDIPTEKTYTTLGAGVNTNTVYGDGIPEETEPSFTTPLTPPDCTQVAMFITTEGRFATQLCTRPW